LDTPRVVAAASFAWAVALLAGQAALAWRRRGRDYAVAAASPWLGLVYTFTLGLSPARKETARRHPLKLGAGIILHVAIGAAIARAVAFVAIPTRDLLPGATIALCASGVPAAASLLANRAYHPILRAMNGADDYAAILFTGAFIALAAAAALKLIPSYLFGYAAAAFFFYLPLGKLRHALFCPLARAELGLRLGRRGVLFLFTAR